MKTDLLPTQVESIDLKTRWRLFCRRAGVTQSEALRALMVHALSEEKEPLSHVQFLPEYGRHQRIELRLTQPEYDISRQVALSVGLSANRWIVALIRAYLSGEPQFGAQELAALSESNYQLASISRNLNQIARAMNANTGLDTRQMVLFEALKREIDSHLDRVHQVMRANIERWGR